MPRPPRPATRPISIHALREEGDSVPTAVLLAQRNFYPRPPRGGRPLAPHRGSLRSKISIHALREEGDILVTGNSLPQRYFYPRPPRGGRLAASTNSGSQCSFLSTPSARRATYLVASDPDLTVHFYPRPPRGGRPPRSPCGAGPGWISIHALREEGDSGSTMQTPTIHQFLSTPSVRRTTRGY